MLETIVKHSSVYFPWIYYRCYSEIKTKISLVAHQIRFCYISDVNISHTAEKIISGMGLKKSLEKRLVVEIMPQSFVATEEGVLWLEQNGLNIA